MFSFLKDLVRSTLPIPIRCKVFVIELHLYMFLHCGQVALSNSELFFASPALFFASIVLTFQNTADLESMYMYFSSLSAHFTNSINISSHPKALLFFVYLRAILISYLLIAGRSPNNFYLKLPFYCCNCQR